jgi:hypothetical protein
MNQRYIKSHKGKLCLSRPLATYQYKKYQPVTDILNPLGPGVKISFETVEKP